MPGLIRLAQDSKAPPAGDPWKELVSFDPDVHREWRREGFNVGYPAGPNNAVIVDFDDKEVARDFYRKHRSIFGPMVETRKGVHGFFSGDTRPRKLILEDRIVGDIRAGPTYVVYPDSTVKAWNYKFVRGHDWGELPAFPTELFPDKKKEVISHTSRRIKDVVAWVMKIESFQGKGGSAGLVRAGSVLRDGGYSEAEATIVLLRWNDGPTVSPPWSHEEIARAITRVYAKK